MPPQEIQYKSKKKPIGELKQNTKYLVNHKQDKKREMRKQTTNWAKTNVKVQIVRLGKIQYLCCVRPFCLKNQTALFILFTFCFQHTALKYKSY